VEVLKFSGRQVRATPLRIEFDPQSTGTLTHERTRERPAAYVVRNRDIDVLCGFDDVIDRGRKHRAMQLSRLLLGRDAIPLIRGTYGDSGQLVRGVRSLLAHAAKRNDRNIYVIGADPGVFKKLWIMAGKDGVKAAEAAGWIVSCQEVLDLLHDTEVPPELERRFIGTSRAIQLVRRLIVRAASTPEDVLILGAVVREERGAVEERESLKPGASSLRMTARIDERGGRNRWPSLPH
jgi:hypothetical protein